MDELDLELERKTRPEVVKKGGWLGRIVALLLGIVIGFVGCFGAIAAVIYYFIGVMKIKDGAGYLKGVLGEDFEYTDYIAEAYGDKTTLDLINSTTIAAQSIIDGTGTLNTLNDIYPILYTVIAGTEDADPNAMFNGLVPLLEQYGLELDADTMMKLIINGSGSETLEPNTYLLDYVLDKTYDLAIGDLLQISGFVSSPVVDALFFGEKDVDYTIDADGWKEPIAGGTPWLTLEDLLFSEEDVIGNRINTLPLSSVIDIPKDNNIMMALAYGPESRYKTDKNEIVMLQQTYTLKDGTFYDDTDTQMEGSVTSLSNGVYSLTQDDTTLYLKPDTKGNYLAYTDEACTQAALYKKTTIGALNKDTDSLINHIELGSTLKLTPQSNKVLLALAYGTLGEDYDVENGIIKMRPGKRKRTFGDLTNGGDKLIESIHLADVMDAETDDAIMMYLLYGKKGVHYDLVNNVPTPQQKQIAVLDHNSVRTPYNAYGDTKLDGTLKDVTYNFKGTTYNFIEYTVDGEKYYLDKILNADNTAKTVNVTVKDTTTNTEKDIAAGLYYVYTVDVEKQTVAPVMFEPTTLGELMNDKSMISNLTSRLTLEEVMGKKALENTPMEKLGGYIIDEVPDKIETLTISDVIKDTEKSSILKHLKDSQINQLAEDVEQLKIGQILEEDIYEKDANGNITTTPKANANPVLVCLKDTTITGLSDDVDRMTVGDVFGDEIYVPDGNGGYKTEWVTVKDENGNDVQKEVKLINPTANHVLAALHEEKISELSSAMGTITVGDMFAHEIYLHETLTDENGNPMVDENGNPVTDQYHFAVDGEGNRIVDPNANAILVRLKDTPVDQMNERVESLTVGEIFKDDIYEKDANGNFIQQKDEYGQPKVDDEGNPVYEIKGSWYYLLKDTREFIDADGDGQKDDANPKYGKPHDDYKLTSEMSVMMTNMSKNMETASLEELNKMGIIDLSKNETLLSREEAGEIHYNVLSVTITPYTYVNDKGETKTKTYFCELTVSELFDYVGKLINAVTSPPTP